MRTANGNGSSGAAGLPPLHAEADGSNAQPNTHFAVPFGVQSGRTEARVEPLGPHAATNKSAASTTIAEARKEAQIPAQQSHSRRGPLPPVSAASSVSAREREKGDDAASSARVRDLINACIKLSELCGVDASSLSACSSACDACEKLEGSTGLIALAERKHNEIASQPAASQNPVCNWALSEVQAAYAALGRDIDTSSLSATADGGVKGIGSIEPLCELIRSTVNSHAPQTSGAMPSRTSSDSVFLDELTPAGRDAKKRETAHQRLKELAPPNVQPGELLIDSLVSFRGNLIVNGSSAHTLRPESPGIFTAALHYFSVPATAETVTFKAQQPGGSPGSNLVLEVLLRPESTYAAACGDYIGIRLEAITQSSHEELLDSRHVLTGDEVVAAVSPNESVKTFSVWPHLTSAWRWRLSGDQWVLSQVRWRFLAKKVIPSLCNAVQPLTTFVNHR